MRGSSRLRVNLVIVFSVAVLVSPERDAFGQATLPLLAEGDHIGYVVGFSELNPVQRHAVDVLEAEARSRGMAVGRVQIDWADLEPTPGRYELDGLIEALDANQQKGLKSFVLVATLDTDGLVLPQDLLDDSSPNGLAGGLDLDDPAIIGRFAKLLDRIVPIIEQKGGFALSIANEPDFWIEDRPQDGPPFAEFIDAAVRHVHANLSDQLAITATLASGDSSRPGSEWIASVIASSDVATFNYYHSRAAANGLIVVDELGNLNPRMRRLEQYASGKQILIQELGAFSSSRQVGSSQEIQREVFELAFDFLVRSRQIRAMFVYQLHDASPEFVEWWAGLAASEGLSQDFLLSLRESVGSLGMCELRPDGCTPKASWTQFLEAVERVNQ